MCLAQQDAGDRDDHKDNGARQDEVRTILATRGEDVLHDRQLLHHQRHRGTGRGLGDHTPQATQHGHQREEDGGAYDLQQLARLWCVCLLFISCGQFRINVPFALSAGVPQSALAMLEFRKKVRECQKQQLECIEWHGHPLGPPIIVHCSAGIGRTGK